MSEDSTMMDIQRALGRIENEVKASREESRRAMLGMKEEFAGHKQDDQRNFSSLRTALREEGDKREKHLEVQDAKLNDIHLTSQGLKLQDENTRSIGKWIIGAFGTLAALVAGAVIAALSGHTQIK